MTEPVGPDVPPAHRDPAAPAARPGRPVRARIRPPRARTRLPGTRVRPARGRIRLAGRPERPPAASPPLPMTAPPSAGDGSAGDGSAASRLSRRRRRTRTGAPAVDGAHPAESGGRRIQPGGYRGRVRPDQGRRGAALRLAPPTGDLPGHRRSRPDRDGRRQRRRRRRDLRAGGPELRVQPALGAAAAGARAHRQPGNGRPPGCRGRHRSRQADLRAIRQVLGLVQRRRPVPAQFPYHRHRVHRHLAGDELLRRQSLHLRPDRRRPADRDHRERELQALGTLDVPVHRGQPHPVRAAGDLLAPRTPARSPITSSCRAFRVASAPTPCC